MIHLLLALGALIGLGEGTSEPTTICQVAANPAKYEGRNIIIRAEIVSDGLERSVLFNPSCKGRQGIGLSRELVAGALDPIFSRGDPKSADKQERISATFEGHIVREEANNFTFYKDDGYRFAVRRVFDVNLRQNGS